MKKPKRMFRREGNWLSLTQPRTVTLQLPPPLTFLATLGIEVEWESRTYPVMPEETRRVLAAVFVCFLQQNGYAAELIEAAKTTYREKFPGSFPQGV